MRLTGFTTFGAAFLLTAATVSAQSSDRIAAEGGDVIITPILHSSVQIEYGGAVVHIDPWSAGDLSSAKPADLILVTDDPGHHLDPAAIERLRKPGAPVVLTASGHLIFGDGEVLANGEQGVFAGVPVEAVPAYDMTPGQPWHPPGEANGYVLTLGGKRIFYAGVGECVPEIQALEDIDVAFIPMNLPVDRMRPIPVAECVKTFGPDVVYPIHYDNPAARWFENRELPRPDNAEQVADAIQALRNALEGEPIEVRDRDWYPLDLSTLPPVRSFNALVEEVPQVPHTSFRRLRLRRDTAGFDVVGNFKVEGRLRQERFPELSHDRLVIVVEDADGRELDWRMVRNPSILRAEAPGPDGRLQGTVVELAHMELSVGVPAIEGAEFLRLYQPRWNGDGYMLEPLAYLRLEDQR